MAKIIDMIANPDETTKTLVEKFGVHVKKSAPKKKRPAKNK